MNPPDDLESVSHDRSPAACPHCGANLPTAMAIVCPACDAVLRPDPETEDVLKAEFHSRNLILMSIGAIVVFAGLSALSGSNRIVPLVAAGVYVIAFRFSARRTSDPSGLIALSIVVWLGMCAFLLGILFVGCLVVFGGR